MNAKLDVKQWAIASVAVLIITTLLFVILRSLGIEPWAPPALPPMGGVQHDPGTQRILIWLARIISAGMFVFVYTRGYEGKPGLGEGVRYALWIVLLIYIPATLSGLATLEMSTPTQINLLVERIVEAIICGLVVCKLYRPVKA